MADLKWHEAVGRRAKARAAWAYPHDLSHTRAEGEVIAYSLDPMVLIEGADGERVWWKASLCEVTDNRGNE